MTRRDIQIALESGKLAHYYVWTFMKGCMVCSDGCCDDSFDSIEQTLDTLEDYCGGKWDEVVIDD